MADHNAQESKCKEKSADDYELERQLNDELSCVGCRQSRRQIVLMYLWYAATFSVLRLVFFWYPNLHRKTFFTATSFRRATSVFLHDETDRWYYRPVYRVVLPTEAGSDAVLNRLGVVDLDAASSSREFVVRYFTFRKVRFYYQPKSDCFAHVSGMEDRVPADWLQSARCLAEPLRRARQLVFGTNSIEVHVTPVIKLLLTDLLSPFYTFQIFSVALWFYEQYDYYAGCILGMSMLSLTLSIVQTRAMQRRLKHTVREHKQVRLCGADGRWEEVDSAELVPGDIVDVTDCMGSVTFDAVLISGKCILNESMLTGESVPITKTPLQNASALSGDEVDLLSVKRHNHHILFCGTHILQTRHYHNQPVLVVVFRTGFNTSRGELVRSILYPRAAFYKFERDSYKFMMGLSVFSLAGVTFLLVQMARSGSSASDIAVSCLDMVTIVVPAALPAALTFGTLFAQRRLRLDQIFCISPRKINVAGIVSLVCFDKTGTLTEDELEFKGLRLAEDGSFLSLRASIDSHARSVCVEAMATCHSLTYIDDQLRGDPLDRKMFDATGWRLEETTFESSVVTLVRAPSGDTQGAYEVTILCQFQFSSSLQRMSVVARVNQQPQLNLYVKGSPEMIASRCRPATVPSQFYNVLVDYTRQGYRVLALAYRSLPSTLTFAQLSTLSRDSLEIELNFVGLLVFENPLKPETTASIAHLHYANIGTVMITGSTWAAICEHYGDTWRPKLLTRGRVFARMSPDQKQQLVDEYRNLGYCVAMCGDGANDCGALKAADAGISLSEAEASVASPFTSKVTNIGCVVTLIREGRCAVVTSYEQFKFMVNYALTEFMTCLVLFSEFNYMTQFEFLYVDLFLVLPLSFTFGYTPAWKRLATKPPDVDLVNVKTITSVVLHLFVIAGTSIFGFFYTRLQPWAVMGVFNQSLGSLSNPDYSCYENFVVWIVSLFHYVWLLILFSKGPPYRDYFFHNYVFVFNLIVISIWNLIIIIAPTDPLKDWFQLLVPDQWNGPFKGIIIGVIIIGLIASLIVEHVIVEKLCDFRAYKFCQKYLPKQRYQLVLATIDSEIGPELRAPSPDEFDVLMKRLMSGAPTVVTSATDSAVGPPAPNAHNEPDPTAPETLSQRRHSDEVQLI